MTFFYDLNKKLAGIVATTEQLNEGKQGVAEKIEPPIKTNPAERGKYEGKGVAELKKQMARVKDQMAGYKERGEKVPAELRGKFSELTFAIRAKQAHGGKWSSIKENVPPMNHADIWMEDDMEEGNEFSGALAKARASGAKEFKVDGKTYQVKEGDFGPMEEAAKPDFLDLDKDGNKKESMKKAAKDAKKNKSAGTAFDPETAKKMFSPEKGKTKTGHSVQDTGYSKRYTKQLSDEPETDDEVSDEPKKKGRKTVGAGKGKKIGAKHTGTSKLARKDAIAETDEEMIAVVDKGEYDREGDMAKEQLHTIEMAADELASILSDDENLPEWVQSKITKAMDYIDTARDYMKSTKADNDEEIMPERKLTKGEMGKREKFVKGMKKAKGDFEKRYGERGEEVMYATATKMAKGNKKEESVKETDAPKKAKGGVEFGKGIYESINSQVEQLITEGMNVSVNMSTDEHGQPTKNITVSAEGDDAEALAKLLSLAGLHKEECPGCGHSPCDCAEQVDEVTDNQPDWPTDEVEGGEDDPQLRMYSGGLNGPKSTGQTTGAPFNRQLARQGAGKMAEGTDLGMNLYKELKQFKGK